MAPHVIELALDLSRMPALARNSNEGQIPANVVEVMRVAAESRKACEDAAATTGQPTRILVEAARFYLQQLLFRPNADCYRILGLEPGASRATARSHMRWLLQWLHPDRNSDLDAVYAARVLKAWREVSNCTENASNSLRSAPRSAEIKRVSIRLPWIKLPQQRPASRWLITAAWTLPAGLGILVLIVCSVVYYFGADEAAAIIRFR